MVGGGEKNSPRREAVPVPLRNQNQEKGKGIGKVFLSFIAFWILPLPAAPAPQARLHRGWGTEPGL